MTEEVPAMDDKKFEVWYAEELEITVLPVAGELYIDVSGDYEVGRARFFLSREDTALLGQWLIERAREHHETSTEDHTDRE